MSFQSSLVFVRDAEQLREQRQLRPLVVFVVVETSLVFLPSTQSGLYLRGLRTLFRFTFL